MIFIHNDGKENHQSWEARLELDWQTPYGGVAFLTATGFGSTEAEAVEDLDQLIAQFKFDPNDTRQRVAWDNKPLGEPYKP